MPCPYCKVVAEEGTPRCQRCGMSLERVSNLFGVVPRIDEGISDAPGILSPGAKRSIRKAANELSIRFTQTHFSLIIADVPANTSLSVFAFWIFNEAGISRGLERGSNNYDILLTLDPSAGRASLMLGYGLESFLGEDQLEAILSAARPVFEDQRYSDGIEQIISDLQAELASIVSSLQTTHGLAPIVSLKSTGRALQPSDY